MGLRERLMGMSDFNRRSPGPVSQFEAFKHGPEGPFNPFAGLQQATAPMANAGVASLNGAPTATAPTGGAGAGGGSALSTGAPIGTMAHDGGGGPFTFGFPFGVNETGSEGWEPSDIPEDIGEAGGAGEDSGGGGGEEGGGDDEGGES